MSIASLQHTLTAVASNEVSSASLSNPLSKTFDKILNVITLGIFGAFKESAASDMKNELLDLGKALLEFDHRCPDIPVQLTVKGIRYELSDMPHGGIRLQEHPAGEYKEIDGVSIESLRDMLFSDLLNNPDFSSAMSERMVDTATRPMDFVGMKQEKANACGEACVNMISAYHGIDYSAATNSRFVLEGNTKDDMLDKLRENGLGQRPLISGASNAYTCLELKESLKNGPLLCELKGHYVVVHGANEFSDRVDIYCPLFGNRSASIKDFNEKLDWDQSYNQAPLMQFEKYSPSSEKATTAEKPAAYGKNKDENFSPSLLDRCGVAILKGALVVLGNDWLKTPEEFANSR